MAEKIVGQEPSKEKQVSIYALTDPSTGEIRYIGKANNAEKRFKGHLAETRRKTPVYSWIKSLREKGMIPGLKVIVVCEQSDWEEQERKAIADARGKSMRLLNVADGGDEPYCSKETRAENGRKVSKTRADTPLKERLWRQKKQLAQLFSQGCGSNETRELMRQAAIARPDIFGCFANLKNKEDYEGRRKSNK